VGSEKIQFGWGREDTNEITKQTNARRLPSLNEHIETMIVNLSKNVFFFPFSNEKKDWMEGDETNFQKRIKEKNWGKEI
jgi:hypothetical protein